MLRINLLRHLPGPETPVEPPRGGAGKRLLGLLALLAAGAVIAGAAWFFYASPYKERFARKPAPVAEKPAPSGPAGRSEGLSARDSARLALETRALEEIAAQQAAALRLSRALESFLPGSPGARPITLAVLTAPAEFLLRGEAASPEALSRLQETLVLVPGIDLARSASRDKKTGRGLDFIFSGTVSPDAGADSGAPADSTPDSAKFPDSLASVATDPAPVSTVLAEAALDSAWSAFLGQAAAAGLAFAVLPAAEPTAAGDLRTHAYRVQAACAPSALREFLAGSSVQGSAFGIRRISWEINSGSRLVSLDIMAFSRR